MHDGVLMMTGHGRRIAAVSLTIASLGALSGCSLFGGAGSAAGVLAGVAGGAGAGGGGAGGGGFDATSDAIIAQGPTRTPLSGQANYAGELRINTQDASGAGNGSVTGDLALTVDFDATDNPFSGSASGFAGTVGGQQVALDGQLTAQDNTAGGVNFIASDTVSAAGTSVTTTSFGLNLEGELTEQGTGVTSQVIAGTNNLFMGPDGQGSAGAMRVDVTDTGGETSVLTGRSGGVGLDGAYHIERQ